MACDSLSMTSLLQVVNRLVASCFNSKTRQQTCSKLIKLASLLQLVDKLPQASKMDNLQQVFSCVDSRKNPESSRKIPDSTSDIFH